MNNLAELYEKDYSAWATEHVSLLRSGKFELLDISHLIEELEGMGVSERNELDNRFTVLITHLLKWKFQPQHRSSSWLGSINEQRNRIKKRMKKSPGLKKYMQEAFEEAYPDAVELAYKDTGIPIKTFPKSCPFTIQQVLNDDFRPE